jgi:uncharacterized protein YyaL (SSP411 family)
MIDLGFIFSESIRDTIKNFSSGKKIAPQKEKDDELHLLKTIEWLEQSVVHGKGGSASHYSLLKGKWLNPFPETTGYIIPTLFEYANNYNLSEYSALATKLADWIGDVQLENGACMQGNYDATKGKTSGIVFNTGQNILGFIRAYKETSQQKYFENAERAADFLVASTDEKGIWNKNLHRGLKHTINSRCCWALLLMNEILPDEKYVYVSKANLDWTLQQQIENGWFRHGTSRIGGLPNTHFLSYTCEGLIESYLILKEKKYLDAAVKTADKLLDIFIERKMLFAFWDEKWNNRGKYFRNSKGKFICVTGNIQISIVWMMLYKISGNLKYKDAAIHMLNYIKTIHNIETKRKGINGGIKGSFPIYGSYSMFMYPNWAAKYFCDAMMMKIKLTIEQ